MAIGGTVLNSNTRIRNANAVDDAVTLPAARRASYSPTATPEIAFGALNPSSHSGASGSSAIRDTHYPSNGDNTFAATDRQLPLSQALGNLTERNANTLAPARTQRQSVRSAFTYSAAVSSTFATVMPHGTARRSDADVSAPTFPLGEWASLLGHSSVAKTEAKATNTDFVTASGAFPLSIAGLTPAVSLSSLALLRDKIVTGNGATYTWGGLNSSDWGVASNWSGNVVPSSSDTASFVNISTGSTSPTLASANQSVNALTFAANANAYTIGSNGYSLTIGSGGITQSSSNLETIGVAGVVLGASQGWSVGSGGLSVSAPISGNYGFTKSGSGTLTLTAANTYTGGTIVSGGALALSGSGSLYANQTMAVTGAGSTLLSSSTSQYFLIGDSGTGSLTVSNGGSFVSNYIVELSELPLGKGTVTIAGYGSTWTTNNNQVEVGNYGTGILNITGGGVANIGFLGVGAGSLTSGGTLYVSNGMTTVSGTDGSGHASTLNAAYGIFLGPTGYGTLNITNGGVVTETGGELQLGYGSPSAATLIVNGGSLNVPGIIVGDGVTPIIKLTNPTAANGGGYALTVGSQNVITTIPASISDAAAGDGASGSISGGPGGAGGIDKIGANSLTLGAANTFSGGMQIDGGSVILGNSLALQNSTAIINLANGLNLNGLATATIGGLTGSGALALGNTALTVGNNNALTTYSGVVSGAGSLIKTGTGTLTLSGVNTYTGGTIVNNGTLFLSGSGSLAKDAAITVKGSTSLLNTTNQDFHLGDLGTGSLTISNGGKVNSQLVFLSDSQFGSATATVSGYGSTWSVGSRFYVGAFGSGTLNITGGGVVTSVNADIAEGTVSTGGVTYLSTGVATVSGTDGNGHASTWSTGSQQLNVGSLGNGTLNITNGGVVNTGAAEINLGNSISGSATLIINGGTLTTGGFLVASGVVPTIKLTNPTAANGGGYALNIGGNNGYATAINSVISDAASGDGVSGSIAGGPGGAGGIDKIGAGTLTLNAANTFSGGMQIDGASVILGNSLALQNSTTTINVNNGLNLNGLSTVTLGGLAGTGSLAVGSTALTVGGNKASTSYSGVLSGTGNLTKVGTGTLSLTSLSPGYAGNTTITQGTIAARNTSLGTGQVTVGANGTLAVGEAVNTTKLPIAVSTLTLGGLTVTPNLTQPELTFNLGGSGTNDSLTITSGGTFSTSGIFEIGFASATGASLGAGTYTLMTFTSAAPPTLADYHAVAVGNLADINTGANPFSYATNGNTVNLLFTISSADVLPEPSSLALMAMVGGAGLGMVGEMLRRNATSPPAPPAVSAVFPPSSAVPSRRPQAADRSLRVRLRG